MLEFIIVDWDCFVNDWAITFIQLWTFFFQSILIDPQNICSNHSSRIKPDNGVAFCGFNEPLEIEGAEKEKKVLRTTPTQGAPVHTSY